jgi:FKBP-type peptidyl-prolyl cis-trans isomerase 2
MTLAKAGDTVHFHYTGTLADGSVFDSSQGGDPLVFTLGAGQIIPGLEAAIAGMAVGATRTVTVPAEQAYGPHDPDAVERVPRAEIPPHVPVTPGTILELGMPDGSAMPVTVTASDAESVTLDANHPLAGQDLTFAVEIVAIA